MNDCYDPGEEDDVMNNNLSFMDVMKGLIVLAMIIFSMGVFLGAYDCYIAVQAIPLKIASNERIEIARIQANYHDSTPNYLTLPETK